MTAAVPLTRAALWAHIFGDQTDSCDQTDLMAVWSGQRIPDQKELGSPSTSYFDWPRQADAASRLLDRESAAGREAYVCAHLLTARRRIKENAALMRAAYVDGDGAQPGPNLPRPTATVESSPGRQQFYWRFTEAIEPQRAEQINRRLAYAMGADKSGWDLTQVLRAPGTINHKYESRPVVQIVSIEDDLAYDPDELERILPELPAEATPARAEVKLERSATAAPLGDRDQRAEQKMYAGKRGDEIRLLANGGSVLQKPEGGADISGDDLSYFNALAFWLDKDPARMAAMAWSSGRVRDKWSEVHSARGETYLEMTIGTAIGACRQSFREMTGYDAGDEPQQLRITPPAVPLRLSTTAPPEAPLGDPTTLEEALAIIAQQRQEITEYQQSVRDVMIHVENLAGFVEELQACNATLSTKLTNELTYRAETSRLAAAERALGQVKTYTTNQKAAIRSWAKIVSSKASRGETEAVVTRSEIAEQMGAHESTAGAALKSVFELDAVPFQRWNEYVDTTDEAGNFLRKKITKYGVEGLTSPAAIIEAFVEAGAAQPERVKRYATEKRCPEHPDARIITQLVCAECGHVLTDDDAVLVPIGANHSHREPPPGAVDVLVPITSDSLVSGGHDGAEQVAVVPRSREPVSIEQIRMTDRRASVIDPGPHAPHTVHVDVGAFGAASPYPPGCPAPGCTALGFRGRPDGSLRCLKSGHDPSAYALPAVSGGSE